MALKSIKVKTRRPSKSIEMLLLTIGLYLFFMGFAQLSSAKTPVKHFRSKAKITLVKYCQHPTKKIPIPVPATHPPKGTPRIVSSSSVTYQFDVFNYYLSSCVFAKLTHASKIRTIYHLRSAYSVYQVIHSLRAPPFMA
ncbi:hypothetical protein FHX64_000573 [Microbacter margulisiae]|uniref:Uncharacterized protein n=1 Tax=Microbacter margulisiae TaxID=1350067 RepID=A0A7W5H176_9PORP|nr:hypothetical protein [Microbacter margulisiae]